ncbi:hypothetical protein [Rhizobium mongolense]|uniref:Uncharacterized protein n=1 Tax=Rhizobium mongolense TaxID=57676 RepID=A0A7W6WGC6_9HYPH|nr:hypothetical protein [Rhizobium mongolense]MBB4276604.1 hypothetical protein [Rhizobium mongolense]
MLERCSLWSPGIESALEAAGIAFLDGDYSGTGGPGVRLVAPAGKSLDVNTDQTSV